MREDREEILNSKEAQGRSGAVPGTLADLFVPKFAPDVNAHPVEDSEEGFRPKHATHAKPKKAKKLEKPTKPKKSKKYGTSGIKPTPEQARYGRSLQILRSTTPKPKKPECKCGADLALIMKLLVDDPTGLTTNKKSTDVMKNALWNVIKKDPNNKVKKSDIVIQSVSTKTSRSRRLDAQGRRLSGTVTVAYTIANSGALKTPKLDNNAILKEVKSESIANGVEARFSSALISEPPTTVNVKDDGSPAGPGSYVNGAIAANGQSTQSNVITAKGLDQEEDGGCALHASCALHYIIIITIVLGGFFAVTIVAFKVKKARSRLGDSVFDGNSGRKSMDADDEPKAHSSSHNKASHKVSQKASEVLTHMGINLDFGKGHDAKYEKDDRDDDKDSKDMGGSDTVSTDAGPGNAKNCDDMVKPEPEWGMPNRGKGNKSPGLFDAFTCGGPMCSVNGNESQMRSLNARPAL